MLHSYPDFNYRNIVPCNLPQYYINARWFLAVRYVISQHNSMRLQCMDWDSGDNVSFGETSVFRWNKKHTKLNYLCGKINNRRNSHFCQTIRNHFPNVKPRVSTVTHMERCVNVALAMRCRAHNVWTTFCSRMGRFRLYWRKTHWNCQNLSMKTCEIMSAIKKWMVFKINNFTFFFPGKHTYLFDAKVNIFCSLFFLNKLKNKWYTWSKWKCTYKSFIKWFHWDLLLFLNSDIVVILYSFQNRWII